MERRRETFAFLTSFDTPITEQGTGKFKSNIPHVEWKGLWTESEGMLSIPAATLLDVLYFFADFGLSMFLHFISVKPNRHLNHCLATWTTGQKRGFHAKRVAMGIGDICSE